jgi:hypothetical protein
MTKKRMSNADLDLVYMAVFAVVACLLFAVFAVVYGGGNNQYSQQAQSAVEAQGYQDVTPLGYDNLSCNDAQGAKAGYAFEATNANGARVILTACKRQALWSPVGGWYIVTR